MGVVLHAAIAEMTVAHIAVMSTDKIGPMVKE
jgi:hypothetical protein